MKIQEVMMKQLCCLAWDQVTKEYPLTSSYTDSIGTQLSGLLPPSRSSAYASPQALLVLPPPSSGSSVQPHCYAPVCIYTRILAEFPPSTDN